MSETNVALDLFLHWLSHAHGRAFRIAGRTGSGAVATDGAGRLAVEVRTLLPGENPAWERRRGQLEGALSEALPGRYALWVPSGADLPLDEPAFSEFIEHVRRAAVRLGPHERSYVPLPISLYLRKVSDEGSVITVSGGLNPYWARFTEHVRGTYDLDSRRLHRLPDSEDHLKELLDAIIERSKDLAPGQAAEIETVDAWTLQRLDPLPAHAGTKPDPIDEGPAARGVAVIGGPPGDPEEQGVRVRRNFKRILSEAVPGLRAAETDLRALVVIGYYGRMEGEGATTALRGYDPASYAGIDFLCLAADGLIKPLIQPR